MRCCLVCCSSPREVCILSLTGIQLGTNTTLWPYSALLGLSLSLLSFDECESGRFLRMFLGPINVRANRKDVQLKGKEEYNTVRDKTAYLFLCFPSLLLVLRSYVWDGCLPVLPVQLYQDWLLYLYTRLALRENILRVNGSDIRPWWIKHHYCAMVMALISLTWSIERGPDCAQKQIGVQLFLKWAIMQGVAMILQTLNLSPIWALMAAFEDPLPVPSSLEGAFVKGIGSISWRSNNTTKLFGSESGKPHCWTFFCTAAFGKQYKVTQTDNEAQRRHNVELVQMQESSSIRKEQAR